jgi:hypothetical protein
MTRLPPRPPAPRRMESGTGNPGDAAKMYAGNPVLARAPVPQRPGAVAARPLPRPPVSTAASPRPAPIAPANFARPAPAAPAKPVSTAPVKATVSTTSATSPVTKPKTGGFAKARVKQVEDDDDLFSAGATETVREAAPESSVVAEDSNVQRITGSIQRVIYSTAEGYAVYSVRTKDNNGKRQELTVSVTTNVLFHRNDKIVALGEMGVYKGRETFKATTLIQEIARGGHGVGGGG